MGWVQLIRFFDFELVIDRCLASFFLCQLSDLRFLRGRLDRAAQGYFSISGDDFYIRGRHRERVVRDDCATDRGGDFDVFRAVRLVAPTQRSDLNAATAQLLVLDWYMLVLYPEGAAVDDCGAPAYGTGGLPE